MKKPLSKQTFKIFWRSLGLGCLLAILIEWPIPSNNVIKTWVQPNEVSYDSFQYKLSVIEKNRKNPFLGVFSPRRHYDIFITTHSLTSAPENTHTTSYGHYKEYGFNASESDILELLEKSTVVWGNDGVRFTEPSGHELFFPKETFMGAR